MADHYVGRKKSCAECRKSKARCSLGSPCRRCEERSLTCKYQHCSTARAGRRLRPATEVRERGQEQTESTRLGDRWNSGIGPTGDLSDGVMDAAMESLVSQGGQLPSTTGMSLSSNDIHPGDADPFSLDWDLDPMPISLPPLEPSNDMPGFLGVSSLPAFLQSPKDMVPPPPRQLIAAASSLRPDHSVLGQSSNEPRAPTMLRASHDRTPLAPRATATVDTCFTAKVLLGQLFSYPRMMGRGMKLPPFVFPSCSLDGAAPAAECCTPGYHQCLPETLAICSGLTRAYETRTSGNTSYLWKSIYSEMERLTREYMGYDATQLLEALQAVVIYLLLQANDEESRGNDNLIMMMAAPMRIAMQLHQVVGTCMYGLRINDGLDRRQWVLYESTRRTVCVLFGIELLIDIDLGGSESRTCGGYGGAPLPCERHLWEPVSGAEWTARYKASSPQQRRNAQDVLTIRDLRRARRALGVEPTDDSEQGRLVARVSEWCGNIDEFGMMVWMAVMMGS